MRERSACQRAHFYLACSSAAGDDDGDDDDDDDVNDVGVCVCVSLRGCCWQLVSSY